jgi:hypothetical protein
MAAVFDRDGDTDEGREDGEDDELNETDHSDRLLWRMRPAKAAEVPGRECGACRKQCIDVIQRAKRSIFRRDGLNIAAVEEIREPKTTKCNNNILRVSSHIPPIWDAFKPA